MLASPGAVFGGMLIRCIVPHQCVDDLLSPAVPESETT